MYKRSSKESKLKGRLGEKSLIIAQLKTTNRMKKRQKIKKIWEQGIIAEDKKYEKVYIQQDTSYIKDKIE